MSEEKPSADSDSTPAAPVTESSGEASEATSIPRQPSGPAIETDGTAAPEAVGSPVDEAPAEPVSQAVESALEPPIAVLPAAEPPTAEPPTVEPPTVAGPAAEPPTAQAPAAEPVPTPAAPVDPPAAAAASIVPAAVVSDTPPAPAPAAPRKKQKGLLAGLIFAVVMLVLLGAIGVLLYLKLFADPTRNAVAGNCLADLPTVAVGEDKEVTKARVVSCDDAAATHVVEARIDNKNEAQARNPDICMAYPDSTFIYRAVPPGGSGYVLCLKKLG